MEYGEKEGTDRLESEPGMATVEKKQSLSPQTEKRRPPWTAPLYANRYILIVCCVVLLFLSFVWPTLYRTDHIEGDLVRVNRFTGTVFMFDTSLKKWTKLAALKPSKLASSKVPKSDLGSGITAPGANCQAAPTEVLKLIQAEVRAVGIFDPGWPEVVIKNESTWTVTGFSFTVWMSSRADSKRVYKQYNITPDSVLSRVNLDLPKGPYKRIVFPLSMCEDMWEPQDFSDHQWGLVLNTVWGYPTEGVEEVELPRPASDSSSETATDNSPYIFPDSDKRFLTSDEINGLGLRELKLARNEIYARHGYTFTTDWIAEYFGSKSWYSPRHNQNPSLNTYEARNVELLLAAEKSR